MKRPREFALFLAATVFSVLCAAQTLPKGVVKVTSVEGITEYRLDNGLRLLVFPDQSKPTITVNMTYLVGSRHEGTGEGGMAHLLEHMVFKGSPKHTNIPQELTEHGAQPNGTTSEDRTNYFETFQATDENLKWALDLESDRMVNSFIKKEDFDKEILGGAQRIRGRREQSPRRHLPSHHGRRLHRSQLRPPGDRQQVRRGARAHG